MDLPPFTETVRAIAAYEARRPVELTLTEGEVLTVSKKDPSGWWEAHRANGVQGMIPSSYVETYVPPLPKPGSSSLYFFIIYS